jgi:hypothetical protein
MGVALGLTHCREESRLRVSENRVLRRICEHKREEVARGWRRLHNEELHNLYAPLSIIKAMKSRKMRLGRICSMHVTDEKCIQHFVFKKPERSRTFGKRRLKEKEFALWI